MMLLNARMGAMTLVLTLLCAAPSVNAALGGKDLVNVSVQCSRASSLVQIQIESHRKIGSVVLEVTDAKGNMLYREEGRAMTRELVRRLDKGVFPHGAHTLSVVARDFSITQVFTID